MKPFNLEAALAGEPVITRSGEEVTQITLFKIDNPYPVFGIIGGQIFAFSPTGKNHLNRDTANDLFMASKKRVVWVNLYKNGYAYYYDTEADAVFDPRRRLGRLGGKAYSLEIEE